MWRINVSNAGIGSTGFRASAKSSDEARPTRSGTSAKEASPGTRSTNAAEGKPDGELCSAKHSLRPANFYCRAPQADSVQLAGDFNHWNPVAMQRRDDGWWFIQVMLIHGHHQYRFLVDGKPVLDPRATGVGRNPLNEEVSILAVG